MDNAANSAAQYAQSGRASAPPSTGPSADTYPGQIMHLDQLIDGARNILERLRRQADILALPDDRPAGDSAKIVGRIEQSPEAGPLLFRIQNRNQTLHNLHSEIFGQLNRLDQVIG